MALLHELNVTKHCKNSNFLKAFLQLGLELHARRAQIAEKHLLQFWEIQEKIPRARHRWSPNLIISYA